MTTETKKISIFLDLDQTLISSEVSKEHNFKKYNNKSTKFDFYNMDDLYLVFSRPHLQFFLTYLFDNFNVSIWTAATKDYAIFIIDNLIKLNHPERKINHILYSYHCDISTNITGNSKDLSILNSTFLLSQYNIINTIILDDNYEVHSSQPDNCIIAQPFYFTNTNSENDTFLLQLIPKLQKLQIQIIKNQSLQIQNINNTLSKSLVIESLQSSNKEKAISRKRNKKIN